MLNDTPFHIPRSMIISGRTSLFTLAILGGLAFSSCSSLGVQQTHGGVKYTIKPDSRSHRVEKGKDGSLMYDSPELTVQCTDGRLVINGEPAGTVKKGDHVEITDLGTVLVNGQRRGDTMTGYAKNKERIQQAKHEWMVK